MLNLLTYNFGIKDDFEQGGVVPLSEPTSLTSQDQLLPIVRYVGGPVSDQFVKHKDLISLRCHNCHILTKMSYSFARQPLSQSKTNVDLGQSLKSMITSGARSAERVYFYIPEKSQYERPAGRPAVVTLFERLFLWNGMTNSRTVILIRCHHPISHVFDRYRYPPVPATARGTCRGEGVEDTLSLGNSTTAGPIAFKFGVWLGAH